MHTSVRFQRAAASVESKSPAASSSRTAARKRSLCASGLSDFFFAIAIRTYTSLFIGEPLADDTLQQRVGADAVLEAVGKPVGLAELD